MLKPGAWKLHLIRIETFGTVTVATRLQMTIMMVVRVFWIHFRTVSLEDTDVSISKKTSIIENKPERLDLGQLVPTIRSERDERSEKSDTSSLISPSYSRLKL